MKSNILFRLRLNRIARFLNRITAERSNWPEWTRDLNRSYDSWFKYYVPREVLHFEFGDDPHSKQFQKMFRPLWSSISRSLGDPNLDVLMKAYDSDYDGTMLFTDLIMGQTASESDSDNIISLTELYELYNPRKAQTGTRHQKPGICPRCKASYWPAVAGNCNPKYDTSAPEGKEFAKFLKEVYHVNSLDEFREEALEAPKPVRDKITKKRVCGALLPIDKELYEELKEELEDWQLKEENDQYYEVCGTPIEGFMTVGNFITNFYVKPLVRKNFNKTKQKRKKDIKEFREDSPYYQQVLCPHCGQMSEDEFNKLEEGEVTTCQNPYCGEQFAVDKIRQVPRKQISIHQKIQDEENELEQIMRKERGIEEEELPENILMTKEEEPVEEQYLTALKKCLLESDWHLAHIPFCPKLNDSVTREVIFELYKDYFLNNTSYKDLGEKYLKLIPHHTECLDCGNIMFETLVDEDSLIAPLQHVDIHKKCDKVWIKGKRNPKHEISKNIKESQIVPFQIPDELKKQVKKTPTTQVPEQREVEEYSAEEKRTYLGQNLLYHGPLNVSIRQTLEPAEIYSNKIVTSALRLPAFLIIKQVESLVYTPYVECEEHEEIIELDTIEAEKLREGQTVELRCPQGHTFVVTPDELKIAPNKSELYAILAKARSNY